MVYCQAYGCQNRSGKFNRGKSFHDFPNPQKRPERFKQWAAAVKVEKFLKKSYKWTKYHVICSDHFVASDFEEDVRAKFMGTKPRILLKEEAVPSQFSHKSSSTSSAASSRVEIRSARAETKEYLRTVLEGSMDHQQQAAGSRKASSCPSTATAPNSPPPMEVIESGEEVPHPEAVPTDLQPSLPMEGIESGGEAHHARSTSAQMGHQDPVARSASKKRKGKYKQKRAASKKKQKCCDRHSKVVTANAATQTLSSGLRKVEDKMNQCPDDFTHFKKDHTYAQSFLPILQPSLVMVKIPEASSAESTPSEVTSSQAVSSVSEAEELEQISPVQLVDVLPPVELPSHVPLSPNTSAALQVPSTSPVVNLPESVETSSLTPSGSSTSSPSSPSSPPGSSSSQSSSPPTSPSKSESSSESYVPSSESDMTSSGSEGSGEPDEMKYCKQKKYMVFEDALNELLYGQQCTACTDGHIAELEKSEVGTMLVVKVICVCGNVVKRWQSQPTIGKQPVGNLLMCASILFAGKTYEDLKFLMDLLNLQFLADSTFQNIHSNILLPVIHTFYKQNIDETREEHSGRPLTICGDGRCDSPGYSAKYCTYTCIDMASQKILGMSLIHVSEASSSVAMEKVGFQRTLNVLLERDLDIDVIATDRHTGIRKSLREDYPTIDHQFDVWHLTKSLTKKLTAKSRQKECQELGAWIKSINNHVWWCAQNCEGDELLLIEMIQSITHHVCNIHSWNSGEKYKKCKHQPLSPEEVARKKWITPGSKSHEALQTVLFDRRLVNDLKQLTKACHTGAIEVYHSLYLKYCPKRKHFFYRAMLARAELAVLDHNANTGRKQATVKRPRKGTARKGELRFRYVWSKATKAWIQKRIPEDKNFAYVWDMLVAVLQVKAGDFEVEDPEYPQLPANIAAVPRPSREELMEQATSRFVQ